MVRGGHTRRPSYALGNMGSFPPHTFSVLLTVGSLPRSPLCPQPARPRARLARARQDVQWQPKMSDAIRVPSSTRAKAKPRRFFFRHTPLSSRTRRLAHAERRGGQPAGSRGPVPESAMRCETLSSWHGRERRVARTERCGGGVPGRRQGERGRLLTVCRTEKVCGGKAPFPGRVRGHGVQVGHRISFQRSARP